MGAQLGFFDTGPRVLVDDASGRIAYFRDALAPDEAARLFAELQSTIAWRSERRMMYEREVDVPRLVASLRIGDGLPPAAERLLAVVRTRSSAPYNSIGFNLYRDGRDSVAPHNDTLRELVPGQPIALVSLGSARRMTIRSKSLPRRALDLDLEPGSLLVMSYETQLAYDHAIPKTREPVGARISAAFRVRV